MPHIASRLTTLNDSGSDGWEVFYRGRQMAESGLDILELTIGEHDVKTDPSILDALHKSARDGHTGYASVPGITPLRDAIAQRITDRTGCPASRDNILITPGGQSALFAAHMAACQPGDTGLFIDPYYATYPGVVRAAGAIPVSVATSPDTGFLPQKDTLSEVLKTTNAKSLLINTPNNPTGAVYPPETLHMIADLCIEHDLWLISDEVYDTQIWEGTHLSPRTLPGMQDRTLVVGSMSKSHAMTGSRIGWIAGPQPAIAALVDLATTTTYGVPGYIQEAALFALRQGAALETSVGAPFERRRAIARSVLAGQNTLRLHPAQGAMYLMIDVSGTGLSGEDFANRLLDSCHIAVMPGESFGRSAAGHIRVAMTIDDARFERALKTLCEFAATCCAPA